MKGVTAGASVAGIALVFVAIFNTTPGPVVDHCADGVTAVYAADGTLHGDQNGDGILAGTDCEWR